MSIFGPDITSAASDADMSNVDSLVDLSDYVKKSGARMTGRINMGNKRITDLAQPTSQQDAATVKYVSDVTSLLANAKLDKSGGTLTGDLALSRNKITDLGNPTRPQDAATMQYVGDTLANFGNLLDNIKLDKSGGTLTGDLDLDGNKITGVGEPTENEDAATKGYADRFANHLNTTKIDKTGDTMTGSLNMGQEKITNLGEPTENRDAATKKYVDRLVMIEHDTSLHVLGRFMVWTNEDGTHYVSIRAKKNIDLDENKLVEISSNYINNQGFGVYNAKIVEISTNTSNLTVVDNPGKTLDFFQGDAVITFFRSQINPPWNLSFSARGVEATPPNNNHFTLSFDTSLSLIVSFGDENVSFVVKNRINENVLFQSEFSDLSSLNHYSIEYVDNKLCIWINGEQKDVYRTESLTALRGISLNIHQLGIFTFYEKNLNKQEIIQHFIEYHVSNFTNDEVLLD